MAESTAGLLMAAPAEVQVGMLAKRKERPEQCTEQNMRQSQAKRARPARESAGAQGSSRPDHSMHGRRAALPGLDEYGDGRGVAAGEEDAEQAAALSYLRAVR